MKVHYSVLPVLQPTLKVQLDAKTIICPVFPSIEKSFRKQLLLGKNKGKLKDHKNLRFYMLSAKQESHP